MALSLGPALANSILIPSLKPTLGFQPLVGSYGKGTLKLLSKEYFFSHLLVMIVLDLTYLDTTGCYKCYNHYRHADGSVLKGVTFQDKNKE